MPEVTYELNIEDSERDAPIAMQVIAYDSEGENLGAVPVTLELLDSIGQASLESNASRPRMDVVTDARGKVYFAVYPPAGSFATDSVKIRATWTGSDPFVFIERFREEPAG